MEENKPPSPNDEAAPPIPVAPAPPAPRSRTLPGLVLLLLVTNGALAYSLYEGREPSQDNAAAGAAVPAPASTADSMAADRPIAQGTDLSEQPVESESSGLDVERPSCVPADPVTSMPLDTFIVNLADERTLRFIRVTMTLDVSNAHVPAFRQNMPELRDRIIGVLSERTSAQVRGREGQEALRTDVASTINEDVCSVRAVYFTEFIVQ
jgi:flagellar basal body-associated protein FliL